MTALECPVDTVPGVLDESGLPTQCVSDLPLVEPLPQPTRTVNPIPGLESPIGICGNSDCTSETVVPIPVPELPDTGSTDPLVLAAIGFALLAAATALWAARSWSLSRPRYRRGPSPEVGPLLPPEK